MRIQSFRAALWALALFAGLSSCEDSSNNEPAISHYELSSDALHRTWMLTDYRKETNISYADGRSISARDTMTESEGRIWFKTNGLIDSDVIYKFGSKILFQPSGHTATGSGTASFVFRTATYQVDSDSLIIDDGDTLMLRAIYFNDFGLKLEQTQQDSIQDSAGDKAGRTQVSQWTLSKK